MQKSYLDTPECIDRKRRRERKKESRRKRRKRIVFSLPERKERKESSGRNTKTRTVTGTRDRAETGTRTRERIDRENIESPIVTMIRDSGTPQPLRIFTLTSFRYKEYKEQAWIHKYEVKLTLVKSFSFMIPNLG